MITTTYDDCVASLMQSLLRANSTRATLDDLARTLGCTFLTYHPTKQPAPFTPEDREVQMRCWITLLHEKTSFGGIHWAVQCYVLDGLLQYDRWRTLLQAEDDAYAFVSLLARFTSQPCKDAAASAMSFDSKMDHAVRSRLDFMLARWLRMESLSNGVTQRALAQGMFGEAWVALVYDGRSHVLDLDNMIGATRPAFLPGLITHPQQDAAALPALDYQV
jgi:hypothetical protein